MMKKNICAFATALISITFLATPVLADPPDGKGNAAKAEKRNKHNKKNKGKYSNGRHGDNDDTSVLVHAGISVGTVRQIALDYHYIGYQPLPPGIRKNLARGKALPPGIAKKMVPVRMLGRLPSHPGYQWQVAGTDLVLVNENTAVVADILTGVFK